jgi:hypothetical protein
MTNQEELEFIAEYAIQARLNRRLQIQTDDIVNDVRFHQLSETGRNIVYDIKAMASQIRILREEANWGRR